MDNPFLIKIKGGLGVLRTPKNTLFLLVKYLFFIISLFAGSGRVLFARPLCLLFLWIGFF